MPTENLPSRKKIQLTLSSLVLIFILFFLANYFDLNKKSQRLLEKTFLLPQSFFGELFNNIKAFESEKIFELENKILKLEEDIYEKNLEILSLENKKSYSVNTNSSFKEFTAYVSGFDQGNYSCCRKHRIYISTDKVIDEIPRSITQGSFVVGKTKSRVFDEVEVRLVSDPEEYISIKNSMGFFCIAQGAGQPRQIICENESKNSQYEEGDTFFTTGFDGIYPEGQIVGRLEKIINSEGSNFKQALIINLFFDPYNSMNKQLVIHE